MLISDETTGSIFFFFFFFLRQKKSRPNHAKTCGRAHGTPLGPLSVKKSVSQRHYKSFKTYNESLIILKYVYANSTRPYDSNKGF